LTSKAFNYHNFKQACLILNNTTLSKIEKDKLINKLVNNKQIPINYIAPAWSLISNYISNVDQAQLVMNKFLLFGFTVA